MAAVADGARQGFLKTKRLTEFQASGVLTAFQRDGHVLVWDCGLGKSVGAIALAVLCVQEGLVEHVLVVCERNKVREWVADFETDTDLQTRRHHGSGRLKKLETGGVPPVLVTTYETAKRDLAAPRGPRSFGPGPLLAALKGKNILVVYDESAKLRNRSSGNYKAHQYALGELRKAGRVKVLGLTATPLERGYEDGFNQLRLIVPEHMPLVKEFESRYVLSRDPFGRPTYDKIAINEFVERVGPHLTRKRKTDPDVIDQFPPLVEEYRLVELPQAQRDFYNMAEDLAFEMGTQDGQDMGAWMLLRQIAGHPASLVHSAASGSSRYAKAIVEALGTEFLRNLPSAKLAELEGYLRLVVKDQGAKAVVFPQPVDTPTLTPNGWVAMGDLSPGDYVIGVDGRPVRILDVHDRDEENDVFEIEFSDGAKTRATADHLWEIERRIGSEYKVMHVHTSELRGRDRRADAVPMPMPVEFDSKPLHLPPYTMGAMLGDGTFRKNPVITVGDDKTEILDAIEDEMDVVSRSRYEVNGKTRHRISLSTGRRAAVNPAIEALKEYGLWGIHGDDKFIPADYLRGSVEQRWSLLAGLLDTDGGVYTNGGTRTVTSFSSNSRRLANDVTELVRSLGGLATIWSYVPTASKDSEALHHRVTIQVPRNPFRLPRKAQRWVAPDRMKRRVKSITPAGRARVRCLTIDDDRHLYITSDYVVTHNTFFGQSVLPEIEGRLRELGYPVFPYHGGQTAAENELSKKLFKESEGAGVFLASDAGARGINLPEATYVIEYESALTHAARIQRRERAHRINSALGPVTALTLIAEGTIEESIFNSVLRRNEDHDHFAGDAEAGGEFVSAADRREILRQARQRYEARQKRR